MGIPAPLGVAASGTPPAGDWANAVLTGSLVAVGPTRPFAFLGPMNVLLWGSVNTTLTTTAASLSASVASATGIAAGYAINSPNVPPGTTVGVLSGTTVTLAVPPITLSGSYSPNAAVINNLPSTTGLTGAVITAPGITAGTTVVAVLTTAVPALGVLGSVSISAAPTAASSVMAPPVPIVFARTANAITTTGADATALFTGAGANFVGTVQIERSFDGGATWLPCNIGGSGIIAQYSAGTPVSLTFGEPERQVLYRLNCLTYTSGTINYRISATGQAATSLSVGTLT